MSLGVVVIGGRKFPVESVTLERGGIRVCFTIHGPQTPFTGNLTVFGADGVGCWQGHAWSIPELPPHTVWKCGYDVSINEISNFEHLVAFDVNGTPREEGTWISGEQ